MALTSLVAHPQTAKTLPGVPDPYEAFTVSALANYGESGIRIQENDWAVMPATLHESTLPMKPWGISLGWEWAGTEGWSFA